MTAKKRYAVVGTGGRCGMFIEPIATTYREFCDLVGLCDISQTRMDWWNHRLETGLKHPRVPTFLAADFDRMIAETKPNIVIVSSMDSTHHLYIIRAMELGCDVICEKPMTVDAPKARAIFDTIERTGRSLRVTFNYRYSAAVTKVWELIQQGVIGRPLAVDFSWVLDTSHGADYFRRWHREKDKSGGLLVHKSTHHFDLINWWIGSVPQRVFAMGDLKFYGRKNAEGRGQKYSYKRYTGAAGAKTDPFALVLDAGAAGDDVFSSNALTGLYLNAEKDSGYIRDRNVFGDDISIEDTMAVMATYRNGVILNYSLLAYSPWEGFRVSVTGTKGRLELYDKHGSHIIAAQSDKELAQQQASGHEQLLKVFPMFGVPYVVEVSELEGGHGGGDPILQEQLFSPHAAVDPYNRSASHIDGAASILMGISANESIRTGQPVDCDTLIKLPS